MTTLSEQMIRTSIVMSNADAVEQTFVSATVDGTERHAVERVTWKSGNVSGTRTECGRQARPSSFDEEKPVTCKKCLKAGMILRNPQS